MRRYISDNHTVVFGDLRFDAFRFFVVAAYAYQIFKENYNWSKPIRSVGVRGADLVTDNYWEQIDLFSSVEKREKQMKMDSAQLCYLNALLCMFGQLFCFTIVPLLSVKTFLTIAITF